MKVSVQLHGTDEVKAALAGLPAAVGADAMGNVLYQAAQPILEEAKALVRVRTGELRDSIKIALRTKDAKARRGAGIFIGATSWRAHYTEFGTAHHPPYPFMRPAFAAKAAEARRIIERGFLTEVRKAVARARLKATNR